MIERNVAAKIVSRARSAISDLDMIVSEIRGVCSERDFELIRQGVGLSIGKIITGVLEPVYQEHPELDDRQ